MVFGIETKQTIWERADGKSELNPELTGFRLETAHLSHVKNSNYNNPENGLLVTTLEHYCHHLLHFKHPHKIGLSVSHNNFAIQETCKRAEEDARRLKWSPIKFQLELRDAGRNWMKRLGYIREG